MELDRAPTADGARQGRAAQDWLQGAGTVLAEGAPQARDAGGAACPPTSGDQARRHEMIGPRIDGRSTLKGHGTGLPRAITNRGHGVGGRGGRRAKTVLDFSAHHASSGLEDGPEQSFKGFTRLTHITERRTRPPCRPNRSFTARRGVILNLAPAVVRFYSTLSKRKKNSPKHTSNFSCADECVGEPPQPPSPSPFRRLAINGRSSLGRGFFIEKIAESYLLCSCSCRVLRAQRGRGADDE